MHKALYLLACLVLAAAAMAQTKSDGAIPLPTSKTLTVPAPGSPQRTNSFPTAVALSPDGKYLAILNNGYGTAEAKFQQSIALLDLATNQLRDFPDSRLGQNAKQTYFLGLAWSSNGRELYASVASITDPDGRTPGDMGNGIAVYGFKDGALTPKRFLKLPLVQMLKGQRFAYGAKFVPKSFAIPYPAGIAVVNDANGDELLVAENLADDAVLLNAADGRVLERFDFSQNRIVPSEFPYTVVASRDGSRAWCSLWNGSAVAELDLRTGKVARTIAVAPPKREAQASSHPTALLLTPDESVLFAALANRDAVAVIDTANGRAERYLSTELPTQSYETAAGQVSAGSGEFGGTYPNALAQSADGKKLYVANASSDAVAVFQTGSESKPAYFIPTEWYPTALAAHGDELLIATGKGQGTGPNAVAADKGNQPGKRSAPIHRVDDPRLDRARESCRKPSVTAKS